MYTVLLLFHVIFCILLVAIVLLQVGRGRGMMGFLGSGTAETLFGSRAGDVLTKSTTVIAVLFMVTSLSLAYISVRKGSSVMSGFRQKTRPAVSAPSMPSGEETASSEVVQKGSKAVQNFKSRLLNKIPKVTASGAKTQEGQPAKDIVPAETTKSKISYDEKGNKTVDELKYDASGKLIGHELVTYDRHDKELSRKPLPLTETGPEEKSSEQAPAGNK